MTRHVRIVAASLGAAALLAAGAGGYLASPPVAHCHAIDNRPDPACSPGESIPGITVEQICQPGYATSTRNVTSSTKAHVLAEYGVSRTDGSLEVDHVVSLELGGTNSERNLFPQNAEPRPGFHEKDRLEQRLHELTCHGDISLSDAQDQIRTDWIAAYRRYVEAQ